MKMTENIKYEVREGLENWNYALFTDYYSNNNRFIIILEKVKDDIIYYKVKFKSNFLLFKAKNIHFDKDNFLLCNYFLYHNKKWRELTSLIQIGNEKDNKK